MNIEWSVTMIMSDDQNIAPDYLDTSFIQCISHTIFEIFRGTVGTPLYQQAMPLPERSVCAA